MTLKLDLGGSLASAGIALALGLASAHPAVAAQRRKTTAGSIP